MRERVEELERIRNGNKSANTAKEENTSIDGSINDQENKGKASINSIYKQIDKKISLAPRRDLDSGSAYT